MVNTKKRKSEPLQLLQFNKSVPTRIGIISLVGFSCAVLSLLLQFLNYGAIRGLSKKQLALVQLDSGKTITAKSVDQNQRSPEVIKKFVGDTFTRMFSWDGLVKIDNHKGEVITKQDKGIDIDAASGKNKVTTKAYEAAFAISENQNFRAAFLQKLAQLTPSKIFEGNMQASLIPRYIGEPRLIRNGVWQVDIVATIVTFTTSDNTGLGITFNKTVTVEAVNTPQEITAQITELSRKIYEARSAGLEITQINDLKP